MNDREIFTSIRAKLSPSEQAEKSLFEKAKEIKPGEKKISTGESTERETTIKMETTKKNSQARVRDTRPFYAAAAAAIALALGAGAVFGITRREGLVSGGEPMAQTQKIEDSKTDTPNGAVSNDKADETETTWGKVGALLDRAAADYEAGGRTEEALENSAAFKELEQDYGTDLLGYVFLDMDQNGELTDKRLEIANQLVKGQKTNYVYIDGEWVLVDTSDSLTAASPYVKLKLERIAAGDKDGSNRAALVSFDKETLVECIYSMIVSWELDDPLKAAAQSVLAEVFFEDEAERSEWLSKPADTFFEELEKEYRSSDNVYSNAHIEMGEYSTDTDDEYFTGLCSELVDFMSKNYTPVTLTKEEGMAYESGDFIKITLGRIVERTDGSGNNVSTTEIYVPNRNMSLVSIDGTYYLCEDNFVQSFCQKCAAYLEVFESYVPAYGYERYTAISNVYDAEVATVELKELDENKELIVKAIAFEDYVKNNCTGTDANWVPVRDGNAFEFAFMKADGKEDGDTFNEPGHLFIYDKNEPYVYVDGLIYEVDTAEIAAFCEQAHALIAPEAEKDVS